MNKSFPSPLRGLIFHSRYIVVAPTSMATGFRPLFGDLSSIQRAKKKAKEQFEFPSPLRGLIFHSLSSQPPSFPTLLIRFAWEKKISFIFMVTLLLNLVQSTVFRYARETLKNLQFALSKLVQFPLIFRTF